MKPASLLTSTSILTLATTSAAFVSPPMHLQQLQQLECLRCLEPPTPSTLPMLPTLPTQPTQPLRSSKSLRSSRSAPSIPSNKSNQTNNLSIDHAIDVIESSTLRSCTSGPNQTDQTFKSCSRMLLPAWVSKAITIGTIGAIGAVFPFVPLPTTSPLVPSVAPPANALQPKNEALCNTGFFTNVGAWYCTDIGNIGDEGRSKPISVGEGERMYSLLGKFNLDGGDPFSGSDSGGRGVAGGTGGSTSKEIEGGKAQMNKVSLDNGKK